MEPMRVSLAPLPHAVRPSSVPTRVEEVTGETDVAPEHLWRLVLLDDDDHSYEYVIEMLGVIFGYGPEKAFALARLVDSHGRVTLLTGEKVECEAKQSQIHAYGADPRILASKGSMSAIVEQADTV
jgi:ATP-dependent Clp protease adaptor protein ClpS